MGSLTGDPSPTEAEMRAAVAQTKGDAETVILRVRHAKDLDMLKARHQEELARLR